MVVREKDGSCSSLSSSHRPPRASFSLSPASLGHKEASICGRFVLLSTFQPEMSETQTVEYYIGKAYAIGSNP